MKKRRLNKGFSLMELVIVMAVIGILSLGVVQFFGDNLQFLKIAKKKSERISDISIGSNLLFKDLNSSAPSFFFFKTQALPYDLDEEDQLEDNCRNLGEGQIHRFWFMKNRAACTKGLAIELTEVNDQFLFIKNDQTQEVEATVLPIADMYNMNENNGNLNFRTNRLADLLEGHGLADAKILKIQAATRLVFFDENETRKLTDYAVLYDVENDAIIRNIDGVDYYDILADHCETESTEINDLDKYLRCLPPNGIKKVTVTPVTIVKYRIVEEVVLDDTVRYLERMISKDGENFVSVRIFPKLTQISFYRKNMTTNQISFKASIPKVLANEGNQTQ